MTFINWQSWWTALSDPYWFMREIPVDLLARCASECGIQQELSSLKVNEDFFQWGMFRTKMIVEDLEAKELDLRGFRLRSTNSFLERLTTLFMLVRLYCNLRVKISSKNGDRTLRLEVLFSNCLSPMEFGLKFGGDGHLKRLDCSG